jgi:hypothetical protein
MINGDKPDEVIRNLVTVGGVPKLVYTTVKGSYVGEISWIAPTEEVIRMIGRDFSAFVLEKTSGIVQPSASALHS